MNRRTGGRRVWLFRLLALTVVPALLLLSLEACLRVAGYGYPTDFLVKASDGEHYIPNRQFAWRFFPKQIAREPVSLRLTKKKPSGTYRIIVLGASAALGEPTPEHGFGRILEILLEEQYRDVDFEVVNAAAVAINSHVVRPIAEELGHFSPDLFVIYLGNNEIVGPFGPGTVSVNAASSLGAIRASTWVGSTRIAQLIGGLLTEIGLRGTGPTVWKGMEMAMEKVVAANDPRLDAVHANFRENLKAIVRATAGAGAETILCTVAVNVTDSPPFASLHRSDLSGTEQRRWEEIYREGVALDHAGELTESEVRYRDAMDIDDRYAELHYRLASSLARKGRSVEARPHYLQALELDALRFRADKRINDGIREVGTAGESANLHLLDVEGMLRQASPNATGLPGDELFHEHVHLNFSGNYAVARLMAEKVAGLLPETIARNRIPGAAMPTRERCAELLPLTVWDRARMQRILGGLLDRPPFTSQFDHETRKTSHGKSMADLHRQITPLVLARTEELYRGALERFPQDILRRLTYARLLAERGRIVEALEQLEVLTPWCSENSTFLTQLAVARHAARGFTEAEGHFRRALAIAPNNLQINYFFVTALRREERVDEALEHLHELDDRIGGNAEIRWALAAILRGREEWGETIEALNRVLKLEPDHVPAMMELAWLLATSPEESTRDGRRAVDLAREAARATGFENPRALDVLAAAHAENGSFAEAVQTAQTAIARSVSEGRSDANIRARLGLYRAGRPFRQKGSEHVPE